MAIHFFDEGLESPAGSIKCDVVVNHTVELTEEEKAQMKEKARKEEEERKRKEWETADMLFAFDEEDE